MRVLRVGTDALLVEVAGLGERSDERCTGAGEHRCHRPSDRIPNTSCIVNQPWRPLTQRAAVRAPRANAPRSRAVWDSVIDSDGPSKPIVCVPGMNPARVDDTSIGRV